MLLYAINYENITYLILISTKYDERYLRLNNIRPFIDTLIKY